MNMYLIILIIILSIISLIFIILYNKNKKINKEYSLYYNEIKDYKNNKQKYKAELDKLNIETNNATQKVESIKQQYTEKREDLEVLQSLVDKKSKKLEQLELKVKEKTKNFEQEVNNQKEQQKKKLEQFKKVTSQAMNFYIDTLQTNYNDSEKAYQEKLAKVKQEYNQINTELDQLKATKKAAYETLLKERQVQQNQDYYRLLPTAAELTDISALQHLKHTLTKPRILSMLIWQYYFQPIAKEKFPIILQDKTKIGIYKITNILSNQCYIGQSVDIYKRFCDHCKAGLGIDAPVGNKLYKSMQEKGLQNFTFQLLCQCNKEQLDEKEKYFISLYQSDLYGYNQTKGNN